MGLDDRHPIRRISPVPGDSLGSPARDAVHRHFLRASGQRNAGGDEVKRPGWDGSSDDRPDTVSDKLTIWSPLAIRDIANACQVTACLGFR